MEKRRRWRRLLTGASEGDLGPHRERVERRTGIAGVERADLLADVAMQVVEHEAYVAVRVPVQASGINRLTAAGDAIGGRQLVVEVDDAVTTGEFDGTQPAAGQ